MNTIEIENSYNKLNKFWCHLCKKEFHLPSNDKNTEDQEIQCKFCKDFFCELIESRINHPSEFIPFDLSTIQNRRNNINSTTSSSTSTNSLFGSLSLNPTSDFMMLQRTNYPRTSSNLLDVVLNLLRDRHTEENSMENIINHIMANDTNRYGNPPAGKKALEELERLEVTLENIKNIGKDDHENSCSVCKDLFEVKQTAIKLPCKHTYHDDCIMPWLKERNSCPTCRFELTTDDDNYELRKNSNSSN